MPCALVTGSAQRLGRAMALCLAEEGFDVAVHYSSSKAHADKLCDEIKAMGRKALACRADLLNDEETEALLPFASKGLGGPITCLINNASVFEYDNLESATRQSWDRHFQSNLRAPFLLAQSFAQQVPPAERDENGEILSQGLIVNMVDQRVRKLTPEFMTYTLAKTALWTFTQTAARALAPVIRVNAIGPGPTLKATRQSRDHFNAQRRNVLLQRGANLSDITYTLKYFLNSPSVTGQLICTDGGQHLGWETPDVRGDE